MSDSQSTVPHFASALSTGAEWSHAIDEICEQINAQLPAKPDLAFAFVSADLSDACDRIGDTLCDRLQTINLVGCTAESVAGMGRELEGETAVSVWAACLPETELQIMHLTFERSPDGGVITGWPDELQGEWPPGTTILLLGDPFSFPVDAMLERLNDDRPGIPVIGGMASGATTAGESRLMHGHDVHHEGALAIMLGPGIKVRAVVSQGCRPIGRHFVITKAERNVIFELGGKPAILQLKEIFDQLPTREQRLVQNGLHIGRVVSEYQTEFQQGDFLIRNVLGLNPDEGSIVVGDFMRPGQTVQFQIRDEETADHEMQLLLATARANLDSSPAAALLFTCNGRGTRLFREAHHDAGVIKNALGDIPLAGFFAAGEIGPVADKNFIHGFTASVAIFESLQSGR